MEVFRKQALVRMIHKILEYYFLFVIAFVSFGIQIRLTKFNFGPTYSICKLVYILTVFAVLIKITFIYKNKTLWLAMSAAAVFYFAFPFECYMYQAFYALLIVGCVEVNIRKIYYAAFVPATLVIINMIFAAFGGAIDNIAYLARGIRSCWGHGYPTDFGTAVICIVVFMWLLLKDLPEWIFIIPAGFSLWLSAYITKSFTSEYVTILFIAMLLFGIFEKRVLKQSGKGEIINKIVNTVLISAFPVFGAITILAVYAYYKEVPFSGTLDTLFHGRLIYPARMLIKYGLKPFGTFFDMIGFGGSAIAENSEYNFLDSSYPQILIRYGYITYIVANILWVYTSWKAAKSDNRRLLYAMALLAADFVMEHHWYELSYNVFIIIPFADYGVNQIKECELVKKFKCKWNDKKYAKVYLITGAVLCVGSFLLLPVLFSWLRTLFNGYNMHGGGISGLIVFAVMSIILSIFVLFMCTLCNLTAEYKSAKKVGKSGLVSFVIAGLVLLGCVIIADRIICTVTRNNEERINEEMEIIDLMVSEADGKVYVDKLPEAYIRRIRGIERSYLIGEDFARCSDTTVVVDASWDSLCLSGMGFLYLQISDKDAIYTNDNGVIEALISKGYVLKGYNYYEYKIDLKTMADINDLEMTEDGGLELSGTEQQIMNGPNVDLYEGKYIAKFEMVLEDVEVDQDEKVCRICITSYSRDKENANVELYRRDFDDHGILAYEVPFSGDGRDYEFLLQMEDGMRCEVKSISYKRALNEDIHVKVDSEGRVIRREYYDLDGNPKEMAKGYYGMEYAYDSRDLVIMERYLGKNFEPVAIENGYAEVHKEYDSNKRLIKESYYDVVGDPIALTGGQHTVEKVYDFNGNLIQERYFGIDGENVKLNGEYAGYKRSYDDRNRWVRIEYYGTDGKLVLQKRGYAIIEREYDDEGNVITERYLGTDSEPVIYNGTYYEIKMSYDDNNRCVEERYYGVDNKLVLINGGYAGCRREYDDVGNVIRYTYIGINGKPVISSAGFATWHRIYNSKKQVIREEYYDANDNKMLRYSRQFSVEYEYDSLGYCIEEKYYDVDGEVVLMNGGYAGCRREYDDTGNVIRYTYIGINGEPVISDAGFATWHRIYNNKKQVVREEYYDVNDKKILRPSGQFAVEYEYDSAGNCIEERYYDVDGEPALIKGGYAGCRREYDEFGNAIHNIYLGIDGEPTILDSGYAIWHRIYNSKKQVAREEYYDVNDEKILRPSGQFAEEYEYDSFGNRIEVRYYGIDNEKILINGVYWKAIYAYNESKKKIREEYYDKDDKPVLVSGTYVMIEFLYNENGELIKRVYKDAAMNVVNEQYVD